ncbi:MAG: phosphonopyruvate decarboxylase [Bradyrhizobium sp.]|jgi:phosphonopyruvate decarboxylase|nr:phosphonopyruvate decarboxylase [Bradyrhizobium sp.]
MIVIAPTQPKATVLNGETLRDCAYGAGIRFFCGVPDSTLAGFGHSLGELPGEGKHVIAANEGSAIALAAGWWLGHGTVPLVYFQNSGLGNAVNPLTSLVHHDVYSIPMVLLIGWRGTPGQKDEPQHRIQGALTETLTRLVGAEPVRLAGDSQAVRDTLVQAVDKAVRNRAPTAILVPQGSLAAVPERRDESLVWKRRDAVAAVLDHVRPEDAIVATTGYIAREVFTQYCTDSSKAAQTFLAVGSMGHASQIALGVALAQPLRRVWCFDGDGALLMHLGGAATIGALAPENLIHIVFDNNAHASVGGHPTSAPGSDFEALARALRYPKVFSVASKPDIARVINAIADGGGPAFLQVRMGLGETDIPGRPTALLRDLGDNFSSFLVR